MKRLTWQEVKDFLETCTPEQLQQSAHVQQLDEQPAYISEMSLNDEDLVWNDDMDEGCIPVEIYDPNDFDGRPLDHTDNTIYPKGTLVWAFDGSFMPD